MKPPIRITIALDDKTSTLFDRLKSETRSSKSGLIRRALRFYSDYKELLESGDEKINTYVDMLAEGEHVIIDLDHWILFLKLIEDSPRADEFWDAHRKIAKSHAEQLKGKIKSVEDLLTRLEVCNFYKLRKADEKEFTLILGSKAGKEFIKTFLEESLKNMGFNVDIKEDYSKLRVKIL